MNQLVAATLQPGMQLYKYQLLSFVGAGNFGEVWQAIDMTLDRVYAIKILKPGISVDQRLSEAKIGNCLTHNNLVRVHHADVIGILGQDLVVLAMDYLPDGSVDRLANPASFLPLPDALRIGKDVLQGLDYLHANHFFHNDIKPGNILIGPQGQATLSDYGITGVSPDGSPVTAPDSYRFHKAPEIDDTGNVGVTTDVFQVGMTLIRLLSGLTILDAKKAGKNWDEYSAAIASGKLIAKTDFPDHLPAAVRRIVLKAINPDASKRFQSALEMRRQLERLHFPGFWTVDASGNLVGEDLKAHYSFEFIASAGGTFETKCLKTSKTSGKTRRVTQFCDKGLTQKVAEAEIRKFKIFVVEGL